MDINSPFTMIVLIVLISVGAGVINNWLKVRANSSVDGETKVRMEDLEREVIRLRERVKVLEKITTDGDSRLRDEIARLA